MLTSKFNFAQKSDCVMCPLHKLKLTIMVGRKLFLKLIFRYKKIPQKQSLNKILPHGKIQTCFIRKISNHKQTSTHSVQ